MASATIRKAKEEDLPQLCRLLASVFEESHLEDSDNEDVGWFLHSGETGKFVSDNLERCMVLLCDGAVAGLCVYNSDVIEVIAVGEAYRSQGYGSQLLREVEDELFEDCARLTLETYASDEREARFYERNGWTEVDRHYDPYSKGDKVVYEKAQPEG
jgi:ribosomal protein S18 acetylase RimI-like enzyme